MGDGSGLRRIAEAYRRAIAARNEIVPVGIADDIYVPVEGRDTFRRRRVIHVDVSDDTHESALGKIDIAKEVARTEGNRLPGGGG